MDTVFPEYSPSGVAGSRVPTKNPNNPERCPGPRDSGAFKKKGPPARVRVSQPEEEEIEFRKIVSVGETFVIVPKNGRTSPGAPVCEGFESNTNRLAARRLPKLAISMNSNRSFNFIPP